MSEQSGSADAPQNPSRWPSRGVFRPPRRGGPRRLVPTWRMLMMGLLGLIGLASAALIAGYLVVEVPEPQEAAAAESTVYRYSDGSVLARTGEVNRENVALDDVPREVQHAVLAAEDRDFYRAASVDPKAMLRASWNMLRGEGRQSGSTITQQYVKNYYLDQEQTLARKAQEFFIAMKLDGQLTRDEILEGYLNTSYFGRNAYGIEAAAHAYYGKNASELNAAEGAYLASVLNAPSVYDVSDPGNRDRAAERWHYVLDGMVSEGWLDGAERSGLEFPEPEELSPPDELSGQRGYLVEAVNNHLIETGVVDEERLAVGGLRITTTIDPDRQEGLLAAVGESLLDNIDDEREQDAVLRAGAASVEPGSGRVIALYGGTDYTEHFVNNATRRDYQAASTFKPFVYAAALESEATNSSGDRIGPNTTYSGDSGREVIAQNGQGTGWAPKNDGENDFGTVSVREAMGNSVNAVFAQLGEDVGADVVADTAARLGISEETPGLEEADSTISLGTVTPSPLDMAYAYATLASHGERYPLTMVQEITTSTDEEFDLPDPDEEKEQVVSRATADATTEVLTGVVEQGTGTAASAAGRPAAGKTGTAEENKAVWFAGYTPELSTVVSLMGQDPETGGQVSMYGALGEERMTGGHIPAAIWAGYTTTALDGEPVQEFDLQDDAPEGSGDGEDSDDSDDPDDPDGESGSPDPDESASRDASPGADSSRGADSSTGSDRDTSPDSSPGPSDAPRREENTQQPGGGQDTGGSTGEPAEPGGGESG